MDNRSGLSIFLQSMSKEYSLEPVRYLEVEHVVVWIGQ